MTQQEQINQIAKEIRESLMAKFIGERVDKDTLVNMKDFLTQKVKELQANGMLGPEFSLVPKVTVNGPEVFVTWEHPV